jgi:hypothetical protein
MALTYRDGYVTVKVHKRDARAPCHTSERIRALRRRSQPGWRLPYYLDNADEDEDEIFSIAIATHDLADIPAIAKRLTF